MGERGDMFPVTYPDDTGPRRAPLSIDWRPKVADVPMWTADKRYYLDVDGNLVDEGDPAMQTLLVDEGHDIPMARAVELGLVKPAKAAKAAKEDAPDEGTPVLNSGVGTVAVKADGDDEPAHRAKVK